MTDEIVINWGPNRELVTSLARTGARFLIMGSTALRFYTPKVPEPDDLDIFIEPSLAALDSFSAAAAPYGFSFTARPTEADLAKADLGFPAKTCCGNGLNLDVFVKSEAFDFQAHWSAALEAVMSFSQTVVRVATLATLEPWYQHALVKEKGKPEREAKIQARLDVLAKIRSRR